MVLIGRLAAMRLILHGHNARGLLIYENPSKDSLSSFAYFN